MCIITYVWALLESDGIHFMAKKTGRPKRVRGGKSSSSSGGGEEVVRIPLELSVEESSAFAKAMDKTFPGATRSYVLRRLIADFCKEAGIKP